MRTEQPYTQASEKEIPEIGMAEYVGMYRRVFKSQMIRRAALARDEAVSYRMPPFQVGCAVLVKNLDGQDRGGYIIHSAHNFKPERNDDERGRDKRCADRNALEAVSNDADPHVIIAMVVACSEKSAGNGDQSDHALHPCKECRMLMRELVDKGSLRNDSVVCSVQQTGSHDDQGPWPEEEMTVGELLARYSAD